MNSYSKNIIITGVAGFIGAAVAKRLTEHFDEVIGIDDLNAYYDPILKRERLKNIIDIFDKSNSSFHFYEVPLEDNEMPESNQVGLIAQETIDIFPNTIIENPDNGRLSLQADEINWALIKAVQELSEEINKLKEDK